MSTNGVDAQAKAHAALHAMFQASRRCDENSTPLNGTSFEASAMRSLFKADIVKVLGPPKSLQRLEELAASVNQLLETSTTSKSCTFNPPPRETSHEAVPCVGAGGADIGCQADEFSEEAKAALETAAQLEELPAPVEQKPIPRMRPHLVIPDQHAEPLRKQVAECRKKVTELDWTTTRLTRELKKGRIDTWTHQRILSLNEQKITELLANRSASISEALRKEAAELEAEEKRLADSLRDARRKADHWGSLAKRRDNLVRQEQDANNARDLRSLIARHPAGEIAGLNLLYDDSDSEGSDSYEVRPSGYRGSGGSDASAGGAGGGRGGGPPQSRRDDVALASSSDEDTSAGFSRSALHQKEDDSDLSEASSGGSPAGAAALGTLGGGVMRAPPGPVIGAAKAASTEPPKKLSVEMSDSDSEGEKAAGEEKTASTGAVVPPLPGLADIAMELRAKSLSSSKGAGDEEVEEVYSEFDEEPLESSRSV